MKESLNYKRLNFDIILARKIIKNSNKVSCKSLPSET